ncbi:MAG: tyrosine-type recombinase/integrase [Lachnospiraceae bacterium]|nr:tyrosine-type recombinase/integrase [Lachnospiraceae bacterium]
MIKEKERRLIKQLALKVHVTESGKPRKITYQDSKELWYTILPGGKKIYSQTEFGLYDKILEEYKIFPKSTSFGSIFTLALAEKKNTENPREATIAKYKQNYHRFILPEFAKQKIETITRDKLMAYTQQMVNTLHPKKKAYLEYKSVLNLVFNYAVYHDIISGSNPVHALKDAVYLKSCDCMKHSLEEETYSREDIEQIKKAARNRKNIYPHLYPDGYDAHAYAILVEIEIATRVGELVALKWSDLIWDDNPRIWIHSQIRRDKDDNGERIYIYEPCTKNERGITNGGREFPMTEYVASLFKEIKAHHKRLGIDSEFIFAKPNGEMMTPDSYDRSLRRLIKSMGLNITKNHVFRKSFNSNVLIPKGFSDEERAALLGHSAETNKRFYSYPTSDYLEKARERLEDDEKEVLPRSHSNIIAFNTKESRKPAKTRVSMER